jgi:hypothetical protein
VTAAGFALLVVIFYGVMAVMVAGAMFVAWLFGDVDPGLTPREVELDAWIEDVLESGR